MEKMHEDYKKELEKAELESRGVKVHYDFLLYLKVVEDDGSVTWYNYAPFPARVTYQKTIDELNKIPEEDYNIPYPGKLRVP